MNNNRIKDFIYFDENAMTSYMAQINDGKIESEFYGSTITSTDTTENIAESNEDVLEATIQGNFIALKGDIHLLNKVIPMSTNTYLSNTEIGKEYALRKVHDNAYNRFEDYITHNKFVSQYPDEADFLLINDKISIFNLDNISNLINSDSFFNLCLNDINDAKEKLFNIKNQKGIENKKALVNNISKDIIEKEKEIKKDMNLLKDGMNLLRDILPTKTVIVTNKYIVPIREEFLRENPKLLLFKYDNQTVSILGKKIKQFSISDNVGIFSSMSNEITQECLKAFNIELENKFIISPVVIYYETVFE